MPLHGGPFRAGPARDLRQCDEKEPRGELRGKSCRSRGEVAGQAVEKPRGAAGQAVKTWQAPKTWGTRAGRPLAWQAWGGCCTSRWTRTSQSRHGTRSARTCSGGEQMTSWAAPCTAPFPWTIARRFPPGSPPPPPPPPRFQIVDRRVVHGGQVHGAMHPRTAPLQRKGLGARRRN